MTLTELIARVGEANIRVQSLHDSATNYQQRKNGDCAVTFLTNQTSASDGLGNPRMFGLVLWMPMDRVPKQDQGGGDVGA